MMETVKQWCARCKRQTHQTGEPPRCTRCGLDPFTSTKPKK